MTPPQLKNNPSHRTDEELVREFVVRQPDLELILERLRENRGASNQHLIIRGPRGMGKTTLVNRVIAEIRTDDALGAAWYPIAFNEESYAVTSAAELWLQALVHLAEQTRDPALERLAEQLRRERDDQRLRERALARLLDFADDAGKRLLIVVENIDMIVGEQLSDEDAWDIRHTLQNEPRIMLLATAVSRLEAFHDADRPLFEIFWEHALRPLEIPEIRAIWEVVTGEEIAERRARPIQILTGGNTRLLVILASFARGRPFRALMDELIALIDENTPYFKHNIESLPREERKIFVALADLWSPATARQVADYTRSDVRAASALLGRLVQRGAVESIRRIGATQLYQVAERMYNLYHLLRRRNSERVRLLVEFMVRFYDVHQLHDSILPGLAVEACTSDGDERRDLIHAIFKLVSPAHISRALPRLPVAFRELPEVHAALQTFAPSSTHDLPEDETSLLEATEQRPNDPTAWIALATFQWSNQQPEASLSSYQRAWALSPSHPGCALSIVVLSRALGADDNTMEALFETLIEQAQGEALPALHALRADYSAHFGPPDKATARINEVIQRWPHNTSALCTAANAYHQLGALDSAIQAYEAALELDPHEASALTRLPTVLAQRGDLDAAIDLLRDGIERLPDLIPLRRQLHVHLVTKGALDEAERVLAAAFRIAPEDAALRLDYAEFLLAARNDPAQAEQLITPILERDDLAVRSTYLVILTAQRKRPEAEAFMARFEREDPPSNDTLVALALLRGMQERPRDGVKLLYRALSRDEQDPRVLDLFVVMSVLSGDVSELRTYLIAQISLHPRRYDGLIWASNFILQRSITPLLPDALTWSEEASSIAQSPDERYRADTDIMFQAAANSRWDLALSAFVRVLALPDIVSKDTDTVSRFASLGAAMGDGQALIKAIEESPSARLLEPILVALRRHEGIAQNPPYEVSQVADDLLKRIVEQQHKVAALRQALAKNLPLSRSPQPQTPPDRPAKRSKTKKRRNKPKRA